MSTSYKRLSFTNEEEECLIEFIKKHPALWDAKHNEYGNGELRKLYWASIAKELNKSVLECRRKWRFIRDYYIHKRRRLNDSTPERDGKYFSLHFLDTVAIRRFTNSAKRNITPRNRNLKLVSNNIERVQKVDHDFEDSEVECNYTPDVTFEKVTMERVDQVNPYLSDDYEVTVSQDQDQDTNDETPADGEGNGDYNFDELTVVHEFPFEQKLEDTEEEHLVETRSDIENEPLKQLIDVSMHEKAIDLFFESMAAAVKTFPPQIAAEAKFKVFNAINELEMKVHSFNNRT